MTLRHTPPQTPQKRTFRSAETAWPGQSSSSDFELHFAHTPGVKTSRLNPLYKHSFGHQSLPAVSADPAADSAQTPQKRTFRSAETAWPGQPSSSDLELHFAHTRCQNVTPESTIQTQFRSSVSNTCKH